MATCNICTIIINVLCRVRGNRLNAYTRTAKYLSTGRPRGRAGFSKSLQGTSSPVVTKVCSTERRSPVRQAQ